MITRYDVNRANSRMDAYPDGDWVAHIDHLAALAAKDAEIARLRGEVASPLSAPAITRAQVSDLLAEALSFYEAASGAQRARALIAAADRELALMRLPPAPRCDGETGAGGGA